VCLWVSESASLSHKTSWTLYRLQSSQRRSDRKPPMAFDWHHHLWPWMTLNRPSSTSLQLQSSISITVYGMQQHWADTRSIERISCNVSRQKWRNLGLLPHRLEARRRGYGGTGAALGEKGERRKYVGGERIGWGNGLIMLIISPTIHTLEVGSPEQGHTCQINLSVSWKL